MSTPSDPTVPSTTPVPTATAPMDASGDQIRQLATQLGQPPYNFDPTTIRKATIQSIQPGNANTPPTGTILFSGDTTSPVAGVRLAAGYGPQVGDTVIVLKQGSDFFMLTDIASASNMTASSTVGGWTQVALAGSHTQNGNSNGNLMYRRVMDGGCWKMQWKGAIGYDGSTSNVLATALGTDFRPPTKVSLVAPRDVNNGGGVGIGLDFQTTGQISIVAANWVTSSDSHSHGESGGTDSVDPGDSTTTDGSPAHSHGVVGSHSHGYSGGTDSDNHSHTAADPTWIGFHGLEYFLG